MKTLNLLAAMALAMSIGIATEANAAKLMYTTPVWTAAGAVDGAARISCGALNLDRKVQTVRAEILDADSNVLNDKSAEINTQSVADITFWNFGDKNGNLFCRFTVNSTKVRPYVTVYNKDFHVQFVMDAK